jgi:hypothetical protein
MTHMRLQTRCFHARHVRRYRRYLRLSFVTIEWNSESGQVKVESNDEWFAVGFACLHEDVHAKRLFLRSGLVEWRDSGQQGPYFAKGDP